MKTLGLIGGSSWVSTQFYYKYLNEAVRVRLGEDHSCRLILYSVNFAEFKKLVLAGDEDKVGKYLAGIAQKLEHAGAEGLMLCANSKHHFIPWIQPAINIPILHIARATAASIRQQGLNKIGLLGTKITMEQPFYKDVLAEYGIETLVPDQAGRDYIHDTIFSELARDIIRPETRQGYVSEMNKLKSQGAEGMILGCTEIPLLIKEGDFDQPLFDTCKLHADYAVDWALS